MRLCVIAFVLVLVGTAAAEPRATIVGTWTKQVSGQAVFMRFDDQRTYRMWSSDGATDTSGQYTVTDGMLELVRPGGAHLSARLELGPQTLVMIRGDGNRDAWTRAAATPTPKDRAELSGADARDPKKTFDEGARLYRLGDMAAAFKWFARAAQLGNTAAYLQLGWHYENGSGVAQSYASAVEWYRKAVGAGDATAMKNLGQLYEMGTGVKEDWIEAAKLYKASAQHGYVKGQVALADAYRFGIGVAQDRAAAIDWYKRAAAQGDAGAADQAHWLRDPTNNIGFRNDREHDLVIGGQLRTSSVLWGADPVGKLFRSSAERTRWLTGLRNAVDHDEAESRRRQAEAAKAHHASEVRRLEGEGYSHDEAERRAGY